MERLSSLPFILDMYGNCGVAQLTELSRGGNLHDLIKIARLTGSQMSPDNKLRIGYQVATAVGDLHSFDGGMPSFTHNDLCCHQFVLIDAVYKLNDFHLASALSKDRQGKACLNRPKGLNSYVRIRLRSWLLSKLNCVLMLVLGLLYYSLTKPEPRKN
jgi:serine/threonine protein kinase